MQAIRPLLPLLFAAASCQTYTPAPVDLLLHAHEFAARLPEAAALQSFAERLGPPGPEATGFVVEDGLNLQEARYVALLYNPSLGVLRQQAAVAAATAEFAGRWQDAQLGGSVARVLEGLAAHPWIVAGDLTLTLPITGLPGLEQALAGSQHAAALLDVRRAEAEVLDQLDAAWVRFSAATTRVDLLGALLQRLDELDRIAGNLADARTLNRLEARVFTLAKVQHQIELAAAEGAARAAELRLRELLGMPPAAPLRLVAGLVVPDRAPAGAAAALPTHCRRVDRARLAHDVAERGLQLAIRRQWPELSLQPGWQEEDAEPRLGLGFSLPLPLWNRNAQEIAERRAARAAAAAGLREQLELASHELAQADAAALAVAAQRRLLDERLLPLAEQQLADARHLADLGQLDVLLILDAVTRAHTAQLAVIAAAEAEAAAVVARNALFWPSLAASVSEPE